jgi:6-phosphogluconolactonase
MRKIPLFCLVASMVVAFVFGSSHSFGQDQKLRFYIGTTVNAKAGGGIFLSDIDLSSGQLSEPVLAAATDRSTFLYLHPSLPVLYSVAELNNGDGGGKGAGVISWKIDSNSGMLTEFSRQPAGGEGACFVIVRPDGRYVAIANYGSGSISLYPLQKDGSTDAASANVQHVGSGPVEKRQSGPHAHSVRFDPSGKRLLAADLGTDDIFIYDISDSGELLPSSPASLEMPAGSGPRHFVFSPDHRFVLGLGEIDGTITTFAFSPNVDPKPLFTVSTMAPSAPQDAVRASAEILFHPTLPVVYCSNRGPHEIAVFDFNTETGEVKRRSAIACGGQVPRNFRFTPDGRYLLVANQGSNNVSVFTVDQTTGDLTATDYQIALPSPMCIKFVPN